jgi:hydrophobic/amphiphilic exporter-1 (mainly G- bacteria), HAE1 family
MSAELRSFSRPFILRPIATSLLSAAIFLAGVAAFFELPVAQLPRVDFPTVQVQGGLPGASPETMASAVATPLERRFGRIAGVSEITSVSSLGSTNLTIQFDLNRNGDAASRDVQAAINAAGGELPTNMPARPWYRRANPSDSPILILSLTSETLRISEIYDAASSVLAQRIAQIDGVGQVFVGGGQIPAVRVQVDPAALASVGLSLEDVRKVLSEQTVDQPKGALSGDRSVSTIAANDQLFGSAAYRDLIVSQAADGQALRLGDIAAVIDDVENNRVAAWANGRRAVLMIIRRQPGANIIDTIGRIEAILPEIAKTISPAITIRVAVDRAQTIRASVRDVERTLYITVALVILVVFVFLRSASATAIPSVAVPISLIGTFAMMYLCDYSLDNLSLMALTISTGFVVDDAIVMTENIQRLIELGEEPLDAALKGAKQIGFTIVSITASLLAVFIPVLLMGGVIGRLFREFAVTLSIAIAFSALVSLTLTPMMCARFLKSHPKGEDGARKKENAFYRALEGAFEAVLGGYGRTLDWVLAHRGITLLVLLATVALTVTLYIVIPKGMFPQQDAGFITGFSEASQDTSFQAMYERQRKLDAIIRADPDVANAVSFIGGGFGSANNTGTIFFDLRPRPERTLSADQVIARLRPKTAQVPGISLFLQAAQDVRVGGRFARTQFQYTLQDADLEELRAWAPRVLEALKKLPMLRDVATDQQTAGLEERIEIDRDTAARLGVAVQEIDATLYDAFGQRQVATTFTELNQYRVILEVKPEYQEKLEALRLLYVRSVSGALVPLSALTSTRIASTSLSINHQGQFPAVTLSFNLAPGASLGTAVDAIHAAEAAIGIPPGLHADFAGTAQVFRESLANQPILIMMALFAVYIVLGVLYESYIHPITILSTLPSAGVGALVALLLTGNDFSIIALIGIILLIGIVKKNAIMMIDFAIELERDQGMAPIDSIRRACLLRFRPIIMTTLAAMFGGLPLALGSGTGSEVRRPLGISIVGGLLISQVLTLYTTPVVYLAMDRFSRMTKKRERARRSHPAVGPGAEEEQPAERARIVERESGGVVSP